ncbi:MAG: beta-ketoacyl-[acyl-carrier-protein] synthase family protein [Flavobacteriales bacterium]|nr:beta-ketoacyl-[acyl-carrier-protein] synthase family protein [Flavobacteriales bacterium]
MLTRVFVTGLGAISSIGNDVEESYQSLINSKTGIGQMTRLDSKHKVNRPIAEVKCSNDELAKLAKVGNAHGYTRTALLGIIAAREAVISAGILNELSSDRVGLISATTVGGMGETEIHYKKFIDPGQNGSFLDYINTHDCGESTQRIADELGLDKGYQNTINTACSSSANAILLGSRLIKHGILDKVIVGGTDALCKFTVNGFNTLMILSDKDTQPFSANRKGLNLGEGAGFVVIESEASAQGKKKYSEVTGYSNGCEAFHQTASSPEGDGAFQVMTEALEVAGLKTSDIDYINAHGTATEINDLSEGTAIQRVFGNKVPKVSSTKSFTGHTLGASGGIEAVFSNLAIDRKTIFPNLSFDEQMPELGFKPQTEVIRNIELNNVLSNAFGFGGNNSAVIFSKIQ